ncbi:MAG: SRPBCC family protein [Saprospiraceae bacterium]|nr:SRPBCC family protein [Saprospiraceae bacterium]
MKAYSKTWTLDLPISVVDAWSFFSRPENLEKITPNHMKFNILSKLSSTEMYEGMMIRYQVCPVLNIPLHWTTEITHCKDKEYFIDEQRTGPFALWHHEHHFRSTPEGVEMKDILTYSIPFGFLGRMINWLFISKQIDSIFAYRKEVLRNKFRS